MVVTHAIAAGRTEHSSFSIAVKWPFLAYKCSKINDFLHVDIQEALP
jgi:hypothetical protein